MIYTILKHKIDLSLCRETVNIQQYKVKIETEAIEIETIWINIK